MQNQIPKDWQKAKLGDVVDISSSKRIFAHEYVKAGIPFYRGKEIVEKFNNASISTDLFISLEKFDQIKKKFGAPQPGDMLLTSVGTLGIPYFVREGERFYFKDGNLTWFRKFSGIDNRFLYYWIQSRIGKFQIMKYVIGSSQPALTIDGLKKTDINLPLLGVQKQIASVLFTFDDKIEINNKIVKTLEDMTQAIFKEWFVNFKFPGYEKVKLVDSELGKIPEGWKVKRIGDFGQVITGKTPSTKNKSNFGSKIPFITIPNMANTFVLKTERYLSPKGAKKLENLSLPKGSVCVSCIATVGLVSITTEDSVTNQQINSVIPNRRTLTYFLYQFFKKNKRLLEAYGAGGSTTLIINKTEFENLNILTPEISILEKFHRIVKPMYEKTLAINKENQKLAEIRDLLLPKLMKGEIRV